MEELQGVELERPLAEYAEALRGLSESSEAAPMRVKPLVQACYQALAFFDLLGVESHFWKADFVERLVDLEKASESTGTVEELVDRDVAGGCVRSSGSHSRNLVRVKRGVELKRALFQLMLTTHNQGSFDGLVSMAYAAVFARYHGKSVQSTITDSICAIPVKSIADFYRMINETGEHACCSSPLHPQSRSYMHMLCFPTITNFIHAATAEESANAEMQKYVDASTVVIRYIDELFTSRGLDTDW